MCTGSLSSGSQLTSVQNTLRIQVWVPYSFHYLYCASLQWYSYRQIALKFDRDILSDYLHFYFVFRYSCLQFCRGLSNLFCRVFLEIDFVDAVIRVLHTDLFFSPWWDYYSSRRKCQYWRSFIASELPGLCEILTEADFSFSFFILVTGMQGCSCFHMGCGGYWSSCNAWFRRIRSSLRSVPSLNSFSTLLANEQIIVISTHCEWAELKC